ncbi:MAG: hypothetical protein A2X58_05285 [Nitrospirae bacterium GWC2_56_14]|nr:MAG: hypothetical protein A2X58_05285 [Nitrospirae bacterium GWC2_56_14]
MFCPHCGKEVSEGQTFCQHCGLRISEAAQAEPVAPVAGMREKTPWEDREQQGFFGGLFKTLKQVLFSPSDFFKKMPVTGGLTDPLLYGLILGMIGAMFSYFWQITLHGAMQNFMTPEMLAATEYSPFQGASLAVLAVFTPFLIILWLFILAGMLHVFLLMVQGAKAGFEATFRVVAYSESPYLFLVLPFCGGFLAWIWSLVIILIGLQHAHETTGGKAAFAVFLPLFICCGLVIAIAAVFMGALMASFGSIMNP